MSVVRIHTPTREIANGWLRLTYPIEGLDHAALVFEIDEAFADFVDDSCDAAVVALLVPAMAAGKEIEVTGTMSPRLHFDLHNTSIPVIERLLPFIGPTRVRARAWTEEHAPRGDAVLTGLSCGVDSFAAIRDLRDERLPVHDRVTHFVFNHIGSHGYGGDLEGRVARRWQWVKETADAYGVPVIRVAGNLPDFYPPEHDSPLNFMATLTVRNASVALLLQARARRLLMASSNTWTYVRVAPSESMTDVDTVLLPALGTERVHLQSIGNSQSRVEKTRRISADPVVQTHLDVCIMEGGANCSRCSKCLRTILTLELLGRLEEFASVFDLEEYERHRGRYVAETLASTEREFQPEIRDLMSEVGYRPTLGERMGGHGVRAWQALPVWIKKPLRRGVRSTVARVLER